MDISWTFTRFTTSMYVLLRVTSLFNTGVSFDEQTKSGDTNPRNERASQSKLKWERANGVSSSTARAQLPCLPSVGHHSCPSRHLVRGAGTRHRLGRNIRPFLTKLDLLVRSNAYIKTTKMETRMKQRKKRDGVMKTKQNNAHNQFRTRCPSQ